MRPVLNNEAVASAATKAAAFGDKTAVAPLETTRPVPVLLRKIQR
jgi:hypothetical protein